MEGCLLVQPLLIVLVRLHTKFFLRIEYFFLRCCFFRFIFSDVDLNPIMHSSVWCVVLTFLLLLLTTQDGNGKLFIFCCQNLNRFSSLASPSAPTNSQVEQGLTQTRTLQQSVTSHERDLPGTPFLSPGSSVPDFERTTGRERTPGSHARSLSNLNCSY